MTPSAASPEPEYVEFSHDGSWGHKREVLRGERAKPTFDELPIIDMADSFSDDWGKRNRVAQQMAQACEHVGFFYITNHGIPEALMDETMAAAKRFFAQPIEAKMKLHIYKSKDLRGYEPVHGANVDPRTKGESFLHNYEPACDPVPPTLTEAQQALLHANQWPDDAAFKAACYRYDSKMVVLLRKMVQLFSLGLGLDEHHWDSKVTHPLASCKMIHYPPPSGGAAGDDDGETGIGAHTDFVCFTVLLQDAVGGLEVLNANGRWVAAPPVRGAYVVNVGDFLMRLTNNRFLSTVHRVASTSGRARYAMPWFCSFNLDATVEVLPSHTGAHQPAAYAPITVAEYYKRRLSKQREEALRKKLFREEAA